MALASSRINILLASKREAANPNVNASMNANRPRAAATIAPTGDSFSSLVCSRLYRPNRKPPSTATMVNSSVAAKISHSGR